MAKKYVLLRTAKFFASAENGICATQRGRTQVDERPSRTAFGFFSPPTLVDMSFVLTPCHILDV